jgi:hypothetical protein
MAQELSSLLQMVLNSPQLEALIGSRTVYLAEAPVRSVLNQLGQLVEIVYTPKQTFSTGNKDSEPPLQMLLQMPEYAANVGRLLQQHPAMGRDPIALGDNFKILRQERNADQHSELVEEVLGKVQQLRKDVYLPALEARAPFLHAALVGADTFCIELLAAPRLVKLAGMVLIYCQNSLDYKPEVVWAWESPRPKKQLQVQQWVDIIIQACPQLGSDVPAFCKAADQLQLTAKATGPQRQHHPLDEVKMRVVRCMELGLFTAEVQNEQRFAYTIVTHIDLLTERLS